MKTNEQTPNGIAATFWLNDYTRIVIDYGKLFTFNELFEDMYGYLDIHGGPEEGCTICLSDGTKGLYKDQFEDSASTRKELIELVFGKNIFPRRKRYGTRFRFAQVWLNPDVKDPAWEIEYESITELLQELSNLMWEVEDYPECEMCIELENGRRGVFNSWHQNETFAKGRMSEKECAFEVFGIDRVADEQASQHHLYHIQQIYPDVTMPKVTVNSPFDGQVHTYDDTRELYRMYREHINSYYSEEELERESDSASARWQRREAAL